MTAHSQSWRHFGGGGEAWARPRRRSGFRCLAPAPAAADKPTGSPVEPEVEPAVEPAPAQELGPQLDQLLDRHLSTSATETVDTLRAGFRSLLGLSPVLRGKAAEWDPDWLELQLTTLAGTLEVVESRLIEVTEKRVEAALAEAEAEGGADSPPPVAPEAGVREATADNRPRAPLRRRSQLEQLVDENLALCERRDRATGS